MVPFVSSAVTILFYEYVSFFLYYNNNNTRNINVTHIFTVFVSFAPLGYTEVK